MPRRPPSLSLLLFSFYQVLNSNVISRQLQAIWCAVKKPFVFNFLLLCNKQWKAICVTVDIFLKKDAPAGFDESFVNSH